ncbi:MAG: hypothetical protein R3A80_05765 [Bdellovibrionota bacterium]
MLFLIALVFFTACTVQPVKSARSSIESTIPANSDTASGATAQLGLWSRGPQQTVDPDDYTLDSTDALNSLSRNTVSLYDLNSSTGLLKGPNLEVFYSKSSSDGAGKASPTISSWSGRKIPWDTKEFKSFMLYAHGSRAIRYMKDLYPSLSFSVRGQGLLPLYAYSSIDDNPLKTKYEINKDGRVGNILFFQYADEPSVRFNPADESDAIYHEFGHVFQHVLNPNVLETGGNYDIDMLLEGLSDFFAASAIRDDRILEYLSSNAPRLFSANNRTGRYHQRKLGGTLHFPEDYTGDFHLDARIVSNALNDIRKYLEGQSVTLYQGCGSNCTATWNSTSNYMSRADAFDTANYLAHEALREIVPTSSIIHYSERIVAAAGRFSWSAQCGSSSTCRSEVVTDIAAILKSRGIHTSNPIRCNSSGACNAFTYSGSSPEIRLNNNGNLYFTPLFTSTGDSNSDSNLDRCEAILAIPDISLKAGIQASSYDTLFELYDTTQDSASTQVGGFTSLDGIDRLTQNAPYFDAYDLEVKLWGFLGPGENIFSLAGVTSSRYYAQHQLAVLSPSQSALTSSNPSPLGWAYRAPSTVGAQGYIEFAFSTRPFEVRYVTEDVYTVRSLKQKLTVSNTSVNFCN